MKPIVKNSLVHLAMLALCIVVACLYFLPAFDGKVIAQGDIQKFEAMAAEQKRVAEATGEIPAWNSAMFSGMPGYQITSSPQKSVFTPIKRIATLHHLGLERNVGVLFLYLIGFYIALIAIGVSPLLALLGAVAFGLGSYNIIIVEAGHITKAWAMAMIMPILAGMLLTFKGAKELQDWKLWKNKSIVFGFVLFTIALGLQITFNHIQITFYTIIGAVILGIVYLIYSIKDKYFSRFASSVGLLLIACALAFGANLRHLLVNQEYAKYTMRGGAELTISPDGKPKQASEGLDTDYAFAWSYGIGETYTLIVPRACGGGSNEKVDKQSESYKAFRQTRMPLYWGNQPFTSGPVYFGAIVCFLFILGLFVVKGPERWWLLVATVVAIVMSWGKNLMWLNEALYNVLPLYNKFRTPSMSLVLANVTMVLMAVLALKSMIYDNELTKKQKNKAIYISAGITVGILLIGLICSNMLSFSGASDKQMAAQYGNQWKQLLDIFVADRKALFISDSCRSLSFVAITAVVLWLGTNIDFKYKNIITSAILAILVLTDLWTVDRRYLSDENFVSKKRIELLPSATDKELDQLAAYYGDKDYRVLNLAVNTFNDSQPSAFHHQIGGYSAAKLRRYQDIIDFYFNGRINANVVNMLNARYVVTRQGIQRNPDALGNAWFVQDILSVDNPNEEILALKDFDPSQSAVVDMSKWAEMVENKTIQYDSTAHIEMQHQSIYNPDHLIYHYDSPTDQLVVFSEIYYEPDWIAYIDGEKAEYFRSNYILRSMFVPAGQHKIEFINEAPRLHKLDNWTIVWSIVLCLVIAGMIVLYYIPSYIPRQRNKNND